MHEWVLSVSVSAVLSLAAELLSVSTISEKKLILSCFNDVVTNRKGKLEIDGKNDHFQNHSDKLHTLMNCWNKNSSFEIE